MVHEKEDWESFKEDIMPDPSPYYTIMGMFHQSTIDEINKIIQEPVRDSIFIKIQNTIENALFPNRTPLRFSETLKKEKEASLRRQQRLEKLL